MCFPPYPFPFPTQKDGHLERPSRSKLKHRARMRRRNAIWYHYRRTSLPTLFWVVLQNNALVFAVVPEILSGLPNPIAA